MSFILDALKKSETDRQRQSGPSLFEVKVAPPRRRLPVWAVAIAALLLINVVVISWMLLRHPTAQPSAAASPAAPAAQAMAAEAAPRPPAVAPNAATTTAAAPAPAAQTPVSQAGAAGPPAAKVATAAGNPSGTSAAAAPSGGNAQGGGQVSGGARPSDFAPAVEPAGPQDDGPAGGTGDALPLYPQIVASANLPALHLDLHVYAARPQDRFVMINMQRVGEGDTLPSGARVEAIRPDGVVLSYHGTRFLLPRN
jgi:general secretion pathway protein B